MLKGIFTKLSLNEICIIFSKITNEFRQKKILNFKKNDRYLFNLLFNEITNLKFPPFLIPGRIITYPPSVIHTDLIQDLDQEIKYSSICISKK